MNPIQKHIDRSRRGFLTTSASGLGTLALAHLLRDEGLLAAGSGPPSPHPTATGGAATTRAPHFAPRAKSCIFLFMAGAPSQLDLFDPKPKLNEFHGKPLPRSLTKDVRFAFIKKESATLMGSKRTFTRHGESGMEFSDLLPRIATCSDDIAMIRSLHTDQFNHHPGQLLMNTGVPRFGFPSVGSWLNYGLGSESQELPGYVVLTTGRGSSGGASNWQSGFMPSTYAGVLFRNQGEPILNLRNPSGVSAAMQRKSLDALADLNSRHFGAVGDPEVQSRIASYELAYRMQRSAPELIDLRGESRKTLDMYGVERKEMKNGGRGSGAGVFSSYATNCLLARRLVERGVRFVNIYHASWDHHSDLDRQLKYNSTMADQPVAALLHDLKQRGLLDSTLVIWGGEFGRTPLGENRSAGKFNTGRDHHPYSFSMWMAGGGVKGGQTLGASDEFGWHAIADRMHVNDFHATLLHLFGFDHLGLTYRFKGRDVRLTDVGGKVFHQLIA